MPEKPRDLSEFVGPFRMTRADLLALKELAKRSERTVAGEIRLAIRNHLKEGTT